MKITLEHSIRDLELRYGEKEITRAVDAGTEGLHLGYVDIKGEITYSIKDHVEPKNLDVVVDIIHERAVDMYNKYN